MAKLKGLGQARRLTHDVVSLRSGAFGGTWPSHCDGNFSGYHVVEPKVVRQTSHQHLSSAMCQQVSGVVFC